jgi:hypothetical protein
METLNDKSALAEFTLYFLCPGSDDEEGWNEERIAEEVKLFDSAQRSAVCVFLRSTLDLPQFSRPHAEFGLKSWRVEVGQVPDLPSPRSEPRPAGVGQRPKKHPSPDH